MRWIAAGAVAGLALCTSTLVGQSIDPTPDTVLAGLKAGNANHVATKYARPHQTAERRKEVAGGQNPRCAVITCADSRVPPELIFDQGLGDLFVARIAGNVVGDFETASLEYAALTFKGLRLVVVMGHSECGALEAAVKGGQLPGRLPTLMEALRPAVERSRSRPGNPVENAIRANVEIMVERIRGTSHILSEFVAKGQIRVVGSVYSLESGEVAWLPAAAR